MLSCSLRKAGDRVAVWTKTAEDEKACLEIGAQFRSAIAECLQGEVCATEEKLSQILTGGHEQFSYCCKFHLLCPVLHM